MNQGYSMEGIWRSIALTEPLATAHHRPPPPTHSALMGVTAHHCPGPPVRPASPMPLPYLSGPLCLPPMPPHMASPSPSPSPSLSLPLPLLFPLPLSLPPSLPPSLSLSLSLLCLCVCVCVCLKRVFVLNALTRCSETCACDLYLCHAPSTLG